MHVCLKGISLILTLLIAMSGFCSIGSESNFINMDEIGMIRSINDHRKILACEVMTLGAIQRVYYITSDQEQDVFCILNMQADGTFVRDVETFQILPVDRVNTPQIAFDNDRRVYITILSQGYPNHFSIFICYHPRN